MKDAPIPILIPARYASSRFPGKPLTKIAGKSMVQRVYENCPRTPLGELQFAPYVVTDDQRIEEHVAEFGGNALRVDDAVESGSERVYLAYKRYLADTAPKLIINLQGDEPLITGEHLRKLADFHLRSQFDITTLVAAQDKWDEATHASKVKAIRSPKTDRCLYFSRAPIPYSKETSANKGWLLHIGVYSYKPQALEEFAASDRSYYEELENLEQLRALEAGMSIGACEVEDKLLGVDTPEDIKALEEFLANGTKK